MAKKFIFICAVTLLMSIGLKLARSEPGYYGKEKAAAANPPAVKKTGESQSVSDDSLSNLEKTDREILNKLNQILNNQEKIMEELKIIKVRASRK